MNNAVGVLVQSNFLTRDNGLICLLEKNDLPVFSDKILECLEQHGELSIRSVLRELSPLISSGEALKRCDSYFKREWRRRGVKRLKKISLESRISTGKRVIITGCLIKLFGRGKIFRISRGVYAPLTVLLNGKI